MTLLNEKIHTVRLSSSMNLNDFQFAPTGSFGLLWLNCCTRSLRGPQQKIATKMLNRVNAIKIDPVANIFSNSVPPPSN